MFKYLYDKLMSSTQGWNLSATDRQEFRDFPSAGMAAELLIAPSALMQLRLAEAQVVIRYMRPKRIAKGTVFIREGEEHETDFMALILDGDVMVENIVISRDTPYTLTVLHRRNGPVLCHVDAQGPAGFAQGRSQGGCQADDGHRHAHWRQTARQHPQAENLCIADQSHAAGD